MVEWLRVSDVRIHRAGSQCSACFIHTPYTFTDLDPDGRDGHNSVLGFCFSNFRLVGDPRMGEQKNHPNFAWGRPP